MPAKPFFVGVTRMQLTKAAHFAAAFGATEKPLIHSCLSAFLFTIIKKGN